MDEPIRRSITVAAKPERVLEILTDFSAYPDWQSDIESAEVISGDEQGRPSQVKLTMVAMGMKSGLEISVRHPEDGLAWSLISGDMMTRNETIYRLQENPSSGTDVELEMLVELKVMAPAFMVKQFISKGINDTLQAIKERAEAS